MYLNQAGIQFYKILLISIIVDTAKNKVNPQKKETCKGDEANQVFFTKLLLSSQKMVLQNAHIVQQFLL